MIKNYNGESLKQFYDLHFKNIKYQHSYKILISYEKQNKQK